MALTPPDLLTTPFAEDGAKNAIPLTETGTNLASFETGFPPVTMIPISSGGIPPAGRDMNGILYEISTHTVWQNAGGQYKFDDAFAAAIGGYSIGMVLQDNAGTSWYYSAIDGNTGDFNSNPALIGVTWIPFAGAAAQPGGNYKAPVVVATTADITLSGNQTIDGVSVTAGMRVLVKNQSTAANNGIYVSSAGAWSRALDADTWAELLGASVFVLLGTTLATSNWYCTAPAAGTIGVTSNAWQVSNSTMLLPITGGTMLGQITLPGGGGASQAPQKQEVVAKAGDTMTGPLILSGDPVAPLGAATKQYTDGQISRLAFINSATAGSSVASLSVSLGTWQTDYAALMWFFEGSFTGTNPCTLSLYFNSSSILEQAYMAMGGGVYSGSSSSSSNQDLMTFAGTTGAMRAHGTVINPVSSVLWSQAFASGLSSSIGQLSCAASGSLSATSLVLVGTSLTINTGSIIRVYGVRK